VVMNDEWQGGYDYFTREEMVCPCGCGGLPCHKFMLALDDTRDMLGFPLVVSSGYRCPLYNGLKSETGLDGPHTIGAADILIFGERALELITMAMVSGITGIGVSQNGPHASRFIHLDCLVNTSRHPRPWIWSY
jgi:zinc D-Ala-D-Ala carboxypeptidase